MAKLRRFLVEVICFTACLLIGAAVFQAIEFKEPVNFETHSNEILKAVVKNISLRYNISTREMNDTIKQLRIRLARGEKENWNHWDFSGCYFFAGTVAFTIGKVTTCNYNNLSEVCRLISIKQTVYNETINHIDNMINFIICTVGFGHQAPKTSLGQLMVIIYAMIAIPITGKNTLYMKFRKAKFCQT
jgi:hypothetical protein